MNCKGAKNDWNHGFTRIVTDLETTIREGHEGTAKVSVGVPHAAPVKGQNMNHKGTKTRRKKEVNHEGIERRQLMKIFFATFVPLWLEKDSFKHANEFAPTGKGSVHRGEKSGRYLPC